MLHKNCKICGERYWGDHTPGNWDVSLPLCPQHVRRICYFAGYMWPDKVSANEIAAAAARTLKIHSARLMRGQSVVVCQNSTCGGGFYATKDFRGFKLCGLCYNVYARHNSDLDIRTLERRFGRRQFSHIALLFKIIPSRRIVVWLWARSVDVRYGYTFRLADWIEHCATRCANALRGTVHY